MYKVQVSTPSQNRSNYLNLRPNTYKYIQAMPETLIYMSTEIWIARMDSNQALINASLNNPAAVSNALDQLRQLSIQ
jgi:hypothetical protein